MDKEQLCSQLNAELNFYSRGVTIGMIGNFKKFQPSEPAKYI